MIDDLVELVAQCGRGAAYDVREALGFDPVYVPPDQRAALAEKLTAALRDELGA